MIAGPGQQATFSFRSMRLRALRQSPADLLAESKGPDEMRFAELGRYIDALKRSGNDANKLIVEQALKLALPATCLIIALFGAPLAVTTPRAGPAGGVAISLAIALIFLLLTQLTKAIGAGRGHQPAGGGLVPQCDLSVWRTGAAGEGEDVRAAGQRGSGAAGQRGSGAAGQRGSGAAGQRGSGADTK